MSIIANEIVAETYLENWWRKDVETTICVLLLLPGICVEEKQPASNLLGSDFFRKEWQKALWNERLK